MTRELLLSVALVCLLHVAHSQDVVSHMLTVTTSGTTVTYRIRKTNAGGHDFAVSDPCPNNEHLAVWESVEEYRNFIQAMKDNNVPAGFYMIGLDRSAVSTYLTTYNGKRLAPYSNCHRISQGQGTAACVALHFDQANTEPSFVNFHNAPWVFQDLQFDENEEFICMDRIDPACSGNTCAPTVSSNNRPANAHCFWRPHPTHLFTWHEAKKQCALYGGHLMDLIDGSDIQRIKDWTKHDPNWNRLWVGLHQAPGTGHPIWTNGDLVDEDTAFEVDVNYGSSSNWHTYAGIYDVLSKGINLFDIAPFADNAALPVADINRGERIYREAFATCEATVENYCLARTPTVANADKTMPCCGHNKVRYTCKAGWEFPDHSIEREVTCDCNTDFTQITVHDCVLRNPCKADANLCKPNGYCIFTNEWQRSHYCLCKNGYRWNSNGYCEDIDECAEGNPCGPYHGWCINTDGGYWCQCKKGMSWDTQHYCTKDAEPSPVAAVHTMTIYFHIDMHYKISINDPTTHDHAAFKQALIDMSTSIYHGRKVSVASFEVFEEATGKIRVKVVFNLYVAGDIEMVSEYTYLFYKYIVNNPYFSLNSHTYSTYGSVYFTSPTHHQNIVITTVCSIYDAVSQCGVGYCQAGRNHYTPNCVCKPGYYGRFCEESEYIELTHAELTEVEIALITCVSILFVLMLLMPLFIWCCFTWCWCSPSGSRFNRHRHRQDEVYATGSVYPAAPSFSLTKVSHMPTFRAF